MNVKTALLVAAFGGASLATSASAFPIASMSSETATIQFQDDAGGDIGRQILRGVEGRGGYRDRDRDRDHERGAYGRGGYRDRDHERGAYGRGGYRHRDYDRRRDWDDSR